MMAEENSRDNLNPTGRWNGSFRTYHFQFLNGTLKKKMSSPLNLPFHRMRGSRVPRVHVRLRNSTPALVNRLLLGGYVAAGGGGDGAGGGKYIMLLVKLSFYDHFMVARGPSMLSTYGCAFLAAVLCATWLVAARHGPLSSYASLEHCNRFRKPGSSVPLSLPYTRPPAVENTSRMGRYEDAS